MNAAAAHYYARIYGSARAGCLAELRRAGCSEEEAEDIFGTTLERIMGKLDPTGSPYVEAQMVSLLKKACLQKLIDERRRGRVLRMVPLEGVAGRLRDGTEGPAEAVEKLEEMEMGREAIASLPERDRRLFLQRYELRLSPDEILSRNPGLSRRTYRKVIQRANARALATFEEIAEGRRCEQMRAGYLHRYVAGEATEKELAVIRVHLRGCRACRTRARQMRSHLHEIAAGLAVTVAVGHADHGHLPWLSARALDVVLDRGQGIVEATRHAWERVRELGLRIAAGAPGTGGDAVAGQAVGISAAKIVPVCAGALAAGCLAAAVVPGVDVLKSASTHPIVERHHARSLPESSKKPALQTAPVPTSSAPAQAHEESAAGTPRSTRKRRPPSALRARKVDTPDHDETTTSSEQAGVEFGADAAGAGRPYSPIPSTPAAAGEESGGEGGGLTRSRSAGSEQHSKSSQSGSEFGF